ncbi:platelet glycoprotein 4-like [Saccoglossus kowalevskii]|uniref:Platelet glycoprotein 4 n=1 Tax=Saccoglossus kowalevskii TaxID=10224 RepID=A0ABM0LXG4_SACKO|nr:PREDICTED: platelet glycoprotein 4-like [Saccoglossus kowalevskii]
MVATKVKLGVSAGVGLLLCAIGLALIPAFNVLIHRTVEKQLILEPSSYIYENWKKPSDPIYMQYWLWDLQNEYEFRNGDQPAVLERGPYTYREYQTKHNITWNANGTVSYRNVRQYVFIPEMSVGLENDTVKTINIPLVTIASMLKNMPSLIETLGEYIVDVLALADKETLIKTLSVKDILWGYTDPIFKLIYEVTGTSFVPSPDFGLFLGQNDTDDGEFTVYTGKLDINMLNIIDRWKGEDHLSWWSDMYANMINGTDATLNPPFSNPSVMHYVFQSLVCRSLHGAFIGQKTVQNIAVDRFVSPAYEFANPVDHPDNAGFCTPDVKHCLPSGFLNVSNCQQGAPIALSLPHYLYADPKYIPPNMNPNIEEHQTYLDAHRLTGITMRATKRMQVNVHVTADPDTKITELSKVTEVFYPVLWLNESYVIGTKNANEFKDKVERPIRITTIVQWTVFALGAFILLVVCILAIRHCSEEKQTRDTQEEDNVVTRKKQPPTASSSDSARLLRDGPKVN